MALITADRVQETSSTTGTGSFTLAGAVTGYRAFSAVCSVGDTFYYSISHQTANEWETGTGTYSGANTLARTTVSASSNSGAVVNFSAGTKNVFITLTKAQLDTTTKILGPISYSFTGTLSVDPFLILVPPQPEQVGTSVDGSNSGKWAASLSNFLPSTTSFSYDDLEGIVGNLTLPNHQGITSFSCPQLKAITGIIGGGSSSYTTISFPMLKTLGGNLNFSTSNFSSLTTLDFSSLKTVNGSISLNNFTALTSISFPNLVQSAIFLSNCSATSFSVPNFSKSTGAISISTCANITTLSFPALQFCTQITASTCTSLTSISLPSLVEITSASTSGNAIQMNNGTAALSSFTIGSTLKRIGPSNLNVVISSCALNQASVDNILVRLAALDGTNGTTAFSNRTVTITGTSSAPSATGNAAKSTLVSRGCTVTTN